MSAFSLPMPPAHLAMHLRRPTERSATTPEDRRQTTDDGTSHLVSKALKHPRDHLIFVPPTLPSRLVDIAEIKGIAQPYPHLARRANRHSDKANKLRL